ncbi:MAG: RNase adapter RapZ [Kiloniellales bacterium]
MSQSELVHATCISLFGRGVLLRGPSGAGKSDLALRLIDAGGLLVADDQTRLTAEAGRLSASAPAVLSGQMEVRGMGIVGQAALVSANVALVVDLQAADGIERLPEEETVDMLGVSVPLIALDPQAASATARIRLALDRTSKAEAARAGDVEGRPVLLVTGMAGAGRSLALDTAEDLGYEVIDNLPLALIPSLFVGAGDKPLALGVDLRTRDFSIARFLEVSEALRATPGLALRLIFLDCVDEVLLRRFSETRRRHPLAVDRPVARGIETERRLIAPIVSRADLVIDTSALRPADFRRLLGGHLTLPRSAGNGLVVFVTSFAYRHGLPMEADLVLDVRFLRNPHYQAELRAKTGRDPAVAAYVAEDPAFAPFFDGLTAWLGPLLPLYEAEGKAYLTFGVGCTGGRHRSVFVAERLARWLTDEKRQVVIAHRDSDRDG